MISAKALPARGFGKPRMVLVTDAKAIEALMAKGKYRESLPFWTSQGDALWVLKDDKVGKRS